MFRKSLGVALAAASLFPALASATTTPTPRPYNYAVIGDVPYGAPKLAAFPSYINQINADPTVHLVLHLGDIKNGSSRCDTSYFEQIRSDFDLFTRPLIYTPGDNEWTDCHRANNGGYQPAGPVVPGGPIATAGPSRLDEVRRIFFDKPGTTLGQRTRHVVSQAPAFPENVRWTENERGVSAAVLNVPGSNNDLVPWFGSVETPALKVVQATEYRRRNSADLRALTALFDKAEEHNSKAVLIGIQADMFDPAIVHDPTQYYGFIDFVQRLASLTRSFGKPVLLLNGDSHVYEADQPLGDKTSINNQIYGITHNITNLKRVTVDGSAAANDYLRLTIDPSSADVFSWTRVPYTS